MRRCATGPSRSTARRAPHGASQRWWGTAGGGNVSKGGTNGWLVVRRVRPDRVRNIPWNLPLRGRFRREHRGAEIDRPRGAGVALPGGDRQPPPARRFRRAAQRDGAAQLQALVDADRASSHRAQHLRAVRKPGVATALLAMAADPVADLDGQRPDRRHRAEPALLGRLGDGARRHVPDQPFRAVRSQPGPRTRPWPSAAAAGVQDAGPLPLRAAPDLSRLPVRLLVDAEDDGRTPAVRHRHDGLHPGGYLFRGTRSHRPVRRAVSSLPRGGRNAAAEAEATGDGGVRRDGRAKPVLTCTNAVDLEALDLRSTALTGPICAQPGSETNSPRPAACDTT